MADGVAAAISVRGLHKSYGSFEAVKGIDFDIPPGQICAILGPNGAGKTTTVEILEGFRHRDSGEVSVLGFDPARQRAELKRHIGIVLQSTGVEPYLTVHESVAMYAALFPAPRPIDEVIDLVGLAEKRNARVVQLSGGQQRRLDMAIALVGDPDLLFLDEPTTGFDPAARHEAWDVVKHFATLGKTVVLTTHFMDEAQYLADTVIVMAQGRIVEVGPPATLGARDRSQVRVRFRLPEGIVAPEEFRVAPDQNGFSEITVADATADVHRLLTWAIDQQIELDGFEVIRPTLEDVYLALTETAQKGGDR